MTNERPSSGRVASVLAPLACLLPHLFPLVHQAGRYGWWTIDFEPFDGDFV